MEGAERPSSKGKAPLVRIAYICADFWADPRAPSGAATHIRGMCSALQSVGHDVRLFCAAGDPSAPVLGVPDACTISPIGRVPRALRGPRAVTVSPQQLVRGNGPHRQWPFQGKARLRLWEERLRRGLYLRRFVRTVRRCSADGPPAFFYERYSVCGEAGVALAAIYGVPLIVEVNFASSFEGTARDPLYRSLLRREEEKALGRISRAAAALLVPAEGVRQLLVQKLGLRGDSIEVLPNGVELHRFDPSLSDGREIRARYGLGGKVVVGFVGSMLPWHDVALLLRSASALGRTSGPVHYLLVGDGPALPSLRRFVAANGLEQSVTFTGAVAHEEVPHYIAALDIAVCLLTKDRPQSSLKRYEYMAMGKAIIASGVAGSDDPLSDQENAIVVPPEDQDALIRALGQLTRKEELRLRLGRRARECAVVRHSWGSRAQRVIELVEEYTSARGGHD